MWNKYWRMLLLFLLVFMIPGTVAASEIVIVVDGEAVQFENPPLMDNCRILVPMREIFTAMGAVVTWDDETATASAVADNVRIAIPIGSYLPTVNDVPVTIDAPAMVAGNCTYIPLRFAVESLGGRIRWEASGDTAFITTAHAEDGMTAKGQDPAWEYERKIDINTSTLEKMLEIDGLDETVARELLSYRETKGGFRSFEEIKNLPSMTDALFKVLADNIKIVYREEGLACWYGDKFHGRMTSSGEVYDKNLHTAAHRTAPFGTMAKVKFLKTGRSVWVRINDRGPHVPDRIIDLSHSAADAIGLTPYGTGWVELEMVIVHK